MRSALRVVVGLLLVAGGVLALAGGVAGWTLGERRTDGAFVTTLAPVQTDGYAIVVPDVGEVLARHGVARHLGDGELTITVRSGSDGFVLVALVPAGQAQVYLSGTARTEIRSVGYTTGEQPVQSVSFPGRAPARVAPWEGSTNIDPGRNQAGQQVTVSLEVPAPQAVALVVRRWDGSAAFGVTISAGFAPSSWATATVVLLAAGLLGTLAGALLLVLRRPWIDPQDLLLLDEGDGDDEERDDHRDRHRDDARDGPATVRRPRRRAPVSAGVHHATESPYVHTAT